MAESAAQPQQQGKPNLSSKLKSMRFMQRASEKRNLQQLSSKGPQQGSAAAETAEDADDAACGSGRHVAEGVQSEATGGDSSLPSTSSSQPAPKKGCRVVYGTAPLPGALEEHALALEDVRRGADVPAADMAHAFQRGGAAAQGSSGSEKGVKSDRGGGQKHQSSGKKRKERS
eukprot:CAMPEP_0202412348 /NCGR_PEP_ID=MMETSP1128-20130828/25298_1 /ASSEMBLY_ACC=CAM_ASM_000463 /TAXON_ID=3047 /ORGANISM="Dunaliella tertiolecta, Strain CCMP1320" /LENGTH=172 /DNA_ID=CAMNT_0049018235 /DNA_START=731 /DNA_END=1250 /DNA_ORIENTATION=+